MKWLYTFIHALEIYIRNTSKNHICMGPPPRDAMQWLFIKMDSSLHISFHI